MQVDIVTLAVNHSFFLFPPLPLSQQVPNFLHELYCVLRNAEILLEFALLIPDQAYIGEHYLFHIMLAMWLVFFWILLLGLAGSTRKCLWVNGGTEFCLTELAVLRKSPSLPELADTGDIVKIFEGILFLLGEGPWFTGWCQHSCFSSKLLIKVADVFTALNYWHKRWFDLTSQQSFPFNALYTGGKKVRTLTSLRWLLILIRKGNYINK